MFKIKINKKSIYVIFSLIALFLIFIILYLNYLTARYDFNILVIGQSNTTLSGKIDSKIPPPARKEYFLEKKI